MLQGSLFQLATTHIGLVGVVGFVPTIVLTVPLAVLLASPFIVSIHPTTDVFDLDLGFTTNLGSSSRSPTPILSALVILLVSH